MLENDDFVAWTNENCLCVVGHHGAVHGEDHQPTDVTDPKTKETKSVCPKYAGLTCAEHQAVQADAQNPKDGLGKITMPGGVPATFMVGPDGAVEQMEQAKSQVAKMAIDELTAFQKKYEGKAIPAKKYETYRKLFADGDAALEASRWKDALAALVKVDAEGKKLSKGLVEKVKAKADALDAKAKARFEELKGGDGDAAARLKAVKALRADVSAKLSTGYLPVLAELDAWIKEQAAVPAAK